MSAILDIRSVIPSNILCRYGTILGATFSAMYPDRVGRVVLDGVSSAALYTTDMFEWGRSGMDDTHKVRPS